ncbi:hypothetical protein [Flagellimonas allohymeniacidonis]|uniref:Cupin domain-containing protein n=1 Tax=Flagellimonas allohymeniacidonis TaxID=2517819 RepID=A0A4Q8Q8R3_9FLAO|nr:hypothetical protein [Allomuricauda hymeniacidonis]TAI46612.1 hypothetical protein EW142_16160 [Allomuricauda hymeniacidonis]
MKCVQLNPEGNFDLWDIEKIRELQDEESLKDSVGHQLLHENETSRLWKLSLWPNQRIPFRKHRYPCSVVCLTSGLAISRYSNGKIDLLQFEKGDTKYVEHCENNYIHDLENVGEHILHLYILEFRHQEALVI